MNTADQIDAFSEEISKVIDRFRDEYDLPYAAAIGALFSIAIDLRQEAKEQE